MSTSPIVQLGGVDLSGVAQYGWTFTTGGKPHMRVFEVSERAANLLRPQLGTYVALEINVAGRRPLKIEKLILLDIRAGKTPYTRGVLVADQRYFWRRVVIVRDFNLTRKTGNVRLVGEGRIENQRLVPDIEYTPGSLDKDGKPFDAVSALENVLKELGSLEGSGTPFTLALHLPPIQRKIVIQDLVLNDPGDEAINKLLSYLCGISLWVDPSGTIQVFDTLDKSERLALQSAGPPLQGAGYHAETTRKYARPMKYNVLFERECELRFDYNEGVFATVIRDRENRDLENVIPVPDVSLTVGTKELGRGTYITMDDFYTAISGTQSRTAGNALGPLSHAIVCKFYLGQWHFLLSSLYGITIYGQPDPQWQKRISAVRACWRRLFRLTPKWRDKIRSLRDYRVALLDPTTGTLAPSEAYMDYISKPSQAARFDNTGKNPDVGYQISGWATLLKDGTAAPAQVKIVDESAGVFRVDLQVDPYGETEVLAPGNVDKLPTHKVEGDAATPTGDVLLLWAAAPLKQTFKMAVVLTAMQAVPNNTGRYHKVVVEPKTGEEVLGVPIGECLGAEAEVYVPAGIQTARFRWDDGFSQQIDDCFFDGKPMPDELMVNADAIKALAEATAAREWATFLDRDEGAFTVAINRDVGITGAITTVEHTVPVNGLAVTSIVVAPDRQPPDMLSLVPASIQKIVRRYVQ